MRVRLALLTALICGGLGACGATPLSVTDLRSSATRICQQAVRQGNSIPGPRSPSASAGFLRAGLPILTRELATLKTLTPPSSMQSNYSTALQAFSAQLTLIKDAIRSLDAGADPVSTFKALQGQLSPFQARGATAWQTLGIPACVNQ